MAAGPLYLWLFGALGVLFVGIPRALKGSFKGSCRLRYRAPLRDLRSTYVLAMGLIPGLGNLRPLHRVLGLGFEVMGRKIEQLEALRTC